MSEAEITVYGTYWCPDCQRAKKFLGEYSVPFNWVDIESDHSAEQLVLLKNNGKRIIPTIVFKDGSILVEPNNSDLARKLGLTSEAKMSYYPLIVVGGGPTGLTAAIYAAREGSETLLLERAGLGGQASTTQGIDNFPGFPEGIGGQEFSERMEQQARRFGVEILQAQEVVHLTRHNGYQCVQDLDGRHYHASAVLVATGASYRRLKVPGEEEYIGAGLHFCATCDGPFYKGAQEVVVIGGGNSACEEGLHMTKFVDQVTLLVRGERLSASQILIDKVTHPHSRIQVRYKTVVDAFEGQGGKLKSMRIRRLDSGKTEQIHPAAAFILIGQHPNSAIAKDTLALDPYGYILTGHNLVHGPYARERQEPLAFESSVDGVFAAGDVRHGSVKQIASAVGEGAGASISIREFLKSM